MIYTSDVHSTPYYLMLTLDGDLRDTAYERDEEKDFPIMQFVGLLDKNGKEIYEGDIVNEWRVSRSFPDGRNIQRVIEWEEDMTLDDSYGMQAVGFCMYGGFLEVIGNIYENPELLKS